MARPFDPARWLADMWAAGYRVAVWRHGLKRSLAIALPDEPPLDDPLPRLGRNAPAVVELLTMRRNARLTRIRSQAAKRGAMTRKRKLLKRY